MSRDRVSVVPHDPDATDGPRTGGRPLGTAVATAFLAFGLVAFVGIADAQTRRAPKPSPTPDPTIAELAAVTAELKEMRSDLSQLGAQVVALGARLDAVVASVGEVKGIVEPMREEVRGLYVETSNVRSEIARLEETYTENTQSIGKSRYVLTLLLVATAVLQLVALAVLLRSR